MAKAKSLAINVQTGSTTAYATWTFTPNSNYTLSKYEVQWDYATGDGVWFEGARGDSGTRKNDTYDIPSNATKIRCRVKPVYKVKKKNGKEVQPKCDWTSWKTKDILNYNMPTPSAPSITVEGAKITVQLSRDTSDTRTKYFRFLIYGDNKKVQDVYVEISRDMARYSFTYDPNTKYSARAQGWTGKGTGHSSDYGPMSGETATKPGIPVNVVAALDTSEDRVRITWDEVAGAESYEVQYSTQMAYLDSAPDQTSTASTNTNVAYIFNLTGSEYFFRVKAVNDNGESKWSEVITIITGKKPEPPTTWSDVSACIRGDIVHLYWVHNTVDSSTETMYNVVITVFGESTSIVGDDTREESHKSEPMVYEFDTSDLPDATAEITWKVRTKGVYDEWSDFSIVRSIECDVQSTVDMLVHDSSDPYNENLLENYPLVVEAECSPEAVIPISYTLEIIANESYTYEDIFGNIITVDEGSIVYTSTELQPIEDGTYHSWEIYPNEITLSNDTTYIARVTAGFKSGLTAINEQIFSTSYADLEVNLDCGCSIDEEILTASITPIAYDDNGDIVSGLSLSVYRCEPDGTYTLIEEGLDSSQETMIVDPHPALNIAYYRIVAIDMDTGAVAWDDVYGDALAMTATVINWNEYWSTNDITDVDEDQNENGSQYNGDIVKLPYNIEWTENNKKDVEMVNYSGRENPVSYYGTHKGSTASCRGLILKEDEDTLNALRRLSRYGGDVYVREMTGVGFWASIDVSIQRNYNSQTIPITLTLTKVDGGGRP